MFEHASQTIWAEVGAMKLDTLLGLVFIVKWLRGELDLEGAVCKLALVPISAVLAIRLNPVLAHLRLVLCLIALLGAAVHRAQSTDIRFFRVDVSLACTPPPVSVSLPACSRLVTHRITVLVAALAL